jgi:hypothetical protein
MFLFACWFLGPYKKHFRKIILLESAERERYRPTKQIKVILLHAEYVISVQIPETIFLFDGISPRSGLLRERATTPWFSMEE